VWVSHRDRSWPRPALPAARPAWPGRPNLGQYRPGLLDGFLAKTGLDVSNPHH
jgi:hypothetical protein